MPQPRLLDVMRDRIRVRHFSYQTETVYLGWARRFIRFHGGRHPRDMSGPEVTQFLSYLAVERKVSASTQNQALSAILFLYKEVLEAELPWLDGVVRAKRPVRIPVVLSRTKSGGSWRISRVRRGWRPACCTVLDCASRSAFACA
jgi:hypothetical protein